VEARRERVKPYPPIGDYALIGDCHSAALVSRTASVDWCCFPRFDGSAVFGRLLDWERGGHCSVEPTADSYDASREYVDGTLVLATTFHEAGGEARLLDCFTMRRGGGSNPYRQLLRIVEGMSGTVEMRALLRARFDYGQTRPWVKRQGPGGIYSAVGGNDALMISCDAGLTPVDEHDLCAEFTVRAGQRVRLSIVYYPAEAIDPSPPEVPGPDELDRRLDDTLAWWHRWTGRITLKGAYAPEARRSAVVLRALVHAPTGAVVAAPTTSLPESPGHGRNWDYRFSWIRDSQFTIRSLTELGCEDEADGFRRFVERSAAGSADALQIMYGLGGERRLTEMELDLEGYRSSSPVRIGNKASTQMQLDVYGYVLDLAWRWHQRGHSSDDDYWRFLLSAVNRVVEQWEEPDCGIWEMRGKPQHFVHSKVMCWTALDRGLRLAEACLRQAPVDEWRACRDEIRSRIERDGYDDKRGVFVQAFGSKQVDASLLLLPLFDFVDFNDERMVRTVDAIREDLDDGGLLRRYRTHDGQSGKEGTFVACSFWLVECLVSQGRLAEAREVFERAAGCGNDLGLFSEEFDPATKSLLGNFPQGLSHLSHIAAAVALTKAFPDGMAVTG
jgi:GH15 family glucan-1,4-alpha-glucosidase